MKCFLLSLSSAISAENISPNSFELMDSCLHAYGEFIS